MTIIFILFYTSISALLILVGLKGLELKGFNVSVLKKFRAKFDPIASSAKENAMNILAFFERENIEKLIELAKDSFFSFLIKTARFLKVGEMIREMEMFSDKIKDTVRGKRFLKNKGAVSFFLRDVAEHKRKEGYRV